ncbi:hypothetical protein LXL04_036797 [Taraxacum kok-saghyz]
MQDKRGKTMGYTKIREGNQKYQKLQGKEVKHVGSRIVADERHRKKMQERIISNFREVSDRFALLPAGKGISNNFGAVLDLFAPVTSSRTVAFEEMMSRFLEKHFD